MQNAIAQSAASAAEQSHVDAILEAMPHAIITLNSAGVIAHANAAAITLLNDTLEGRLWRDVVADFLRHGRMTAMKFLCAVAPGTY